MRWFGLRGAGLGDIMKLVNSKLSKHSHPSTIILHIGTNDIFHLNTYNLRRQVFALLQGLRAILPSTRLIWSDVFARLFYYGEHRPGGGRRITNFINAQAHKFVKQMDNAGFICHTEVLPPTRQSLYRHDGMHLSPSGLIIFRMNLSEALVFFNSHAGAAFPPPS